MTTDTTLKLAIDRLAKVRGQLEQLKAELETIVGKEVEEAVLVQLPLRLKMDSAANDTE